MSFLVHPVLRLFAISVSCILFAACASRSQKPGVTSAEKATEQEIAKSKNGQPATGLPPVTSAANVDAATALLWLQHGNVRYVSHKLRDDGQSDEDRARTKFQQRPHAIVLACSDSRVPVEIIFDQKIGEIYVVRTAAEQVDHVALASIEYAVRRFGTNLIYVLGHNHCDAIYEGLHFDENYTTTSETLDALLAGLHHQLSESASHASISEDLTREAREHAESVAKSLSVKSPMLAKKIDEGRLQIRSGVYRAETGTVETY